MEEHITICSPYVSVNIFTSTHIGITLILDLMGYTYKKIKKRGHGIGKSGLERLDNLEDVLVIYCIKHPAQFSEEIKTRIWRQELMHSNGRMLFGGLLLMACSAYIFMVPI